MDFKQRCRCGKPITFPHATSCEACRTETLRQMCELRERLAREIDAETEGKPAN
jgi:hypothetical protein